MADVLLVIDLQNGVCYGEQTAANMSHVLTGINARIAAYRKAKKPIVFIQHSDEDLVQGTHDWELIPDLDYRDTDPLVSKHHANAFYHTNLRRVLTSFAAESLEICGAQVEYCVDTTTKVAHGIGYDLQMTRGLTTTVDNKFMTADQTIAFFEGIWDHRFVTMLEA
ncbi:cysteine hydrolase family protein [Levilactobacillus yiduensis]|uniref:cysteine hydrolase family protein n=1 Tax=Levilactobacillus yiduensis TaxID=2953880 RepID=UPI000EF34D0A|nr:cysteine hydrolase family protein [Levilactobacillus yiduensis]AYM03275.1 cysteine hydrolase [Levilactobacillus brevis]